VATMTDQLVGGWLSDHIGRRIFFLGTIFTVCFAFPLLWLLSTKDPQIIIATVAAALSFGHWGDVRAGVGLYSQLFGTRARHSGASFGFQLSSALGEGFPNHRDGVGRLAAQRSALLRDPTCWP
jgi:MHS family shikimate/dehydroshikimate transporter-like MFS transporter